MKTFRRQAVDILRIDNAAASAEIALFGGQVLSYVPRQDGRERLWLSDSARWDRSKSIRGGVPICWPWFGAHPREGLPAHGYARTRDWEVQEAEEETDCTRLVLALCDSAGEGFSGQAELRLAVTVGRHLKLALETRNAGIEPFLYNCALHSYFRIAEIGETELRGLSGEYSDKTRDWAMFDTPSPYRFSAETDRIHLHAAAQATVAGADFATRIRSAGHDSLVVWNPWREQAAALPDMAAQDFRRMLCVETAITQGKPLRPGEAHTLIQIID